MNQRAPTFRRHHSGNYFCRWGGKDRYFGREKSEAHDKYLRSLEEWAEWRRTRDGRRLPPMSKSHRVVDLVGMFLDQKKLEGGVDLERYYAKHLKRFLHAYSSWRADAVRAVNVQAVKDAMLSHRDKEGNHKPYAPKTINHDLIAIKALMGWAADMEMIEPVRLRGVKSQPLKPPVDKSLSKAVVRKMVKQASETMAPWLAINYLCGMRPTEVIRVVHKRGEWVKVGRERRAWLYRLDEHKTARTRQHRHIVFSSEALTWLDRCEPRWSRLDSYSQAVRDAFGPGGPHPLRHSAASHLLRSGVDRATVDLFLGHALPRVSVTYAPVDWRSLRPIAARLTLQPRAAKKSS